MNFDSLGHITTTRPIKQSELTLGCIMWDEHKPDCVGADEKTLTETSIQWESKRVEAS